jgi:lactate dehydrogenase-like 2-hydroxyacid dehydrogenase
MTETSPFDQASRRLGLALDALENAIERRYDMERSDMSLAAQLHALDADRSRLADNLDTALARSRGLENINREVARRLDIAVGSIRSVLEATDSGRG